MKNRSLLLTLAIMIIAMCSSAQEKGTFTDSRDGKTYKTVKIGTQTWMAENLAFKAETGCLAYKKDSSLVKTYGYLYTWEAASKSCPAGWHLPSDAEWTVLGTFLGGPEPAFGKLKAQTTWQGADTSSTNSSGFTALAAGMYYNPNFFESLGKNTYWWTSTVKSIDEAWYWFISPQQRSFYRGSVATNLGHSVRCLID